MAKKKSKNSERLEKVFDILLKNKNIKNFTTLSDRGIKTRVTSVLSTGLPSLNLLLAKSVKGKFGLPFGRQIEVCGDPEVGKTSLLLSMVSSAQKVGAVTFWLETEGDMTPERAAMLKVIKKYTLFRQPDTQEECLEEVENSIKSVLETREKLKNSGEKKWDIPCVIFWDSIAATPTKTELDGKVEDKHMALFARQMGQGVRRIINTISKNRILLIYSNQLKDDIRSHAWGKPKTTYGGNAIRFASAIRFRVIKTGTVHGTSQGTKVKKGSTIKFRNMKNKCFPRFYETIETNFSDKSGYSIEESLVAALCMTGLAKKRGKEYKIDRQVEALEGKYNLKELKSALKDKKLFKEVEKTIYSSQK